MDKRYDHETHEKELRDSWEREGIYAPQPQKGQALYSIDTPPPTVSGSLHIGSVFSYTQTDVIARYKRMSGLPVFYPFGFDDNGLPTERYVEKKCKVKAFEMSRAEFSRLCAQEVAIAREQFKELWQRIGLSVSWSHSYSTISDHVQRVSQQSFLKLLKAGHVYRRSEPALYCTACRTSVAQAELDDKEVASHFNDIIFKDEQGRELVVGTTRPELLPSCVALFFHPADERYKHLKDKKANVPIFDHQVPILEDEGVDQDKGTGLVMCCTFGDKADVEWYKKFNLPFKQSIGYNGKWLEGTGILAGLKVHEARQRIIDELVKKELLPRQKEIVHSVNTHERCKKEIEFFVLPQWFVNILDGKKQYIELAEQLNWRPAFMKARYIDWVENISWDWCISRQRYYGIPFPVWHCADCDHTILADEKDLPVDPRDTAPPGGACDSCGSTNIEPDTDVMDTWNTSSLTPYICASLYCDTANPLDDDCAQQFIPMGMRAQAHDIIRTWTFDTVVKAWMHSEQIPWKDVVVSGHALSGRDGKISKSKGNEAITPIALLERFPADAIRYWAAAATLGKDVAFSENQLKVGQRLTTKMWNAFRFTSEHIVGVDGATLPATFGSVNEWILHQASECFADYNAQLEDYEFGHALDRLERFFWHDFCDNYLELIKDQLFNPGNYREEMVAATRWTLYAVGLRVLQLYAPYVPYVSDAIYRSVYADREKWASIHQSDFGSIQAPYVFEESSQLVDSIVQVVGAVRKLKSEHQLSLKTPLSLLIVHVKDEALARELEGQEMLLRGITRAETISYTQDALEEPSLVEREGSWSAQVSID